MKKMVALCKQLGTPLKEEKIEGPTTCITFLGTELDSTSMVARLPADRKLELQDTLLTIRARIEVYQMRITLALWTFGLCL